jgi:hypothetical protein
VSISAIVSTWALHDLGSQENVAVVYKRCAHALQEGGRLLNGDFIKPDKAIYEYESGRFEIDGREKGSINIDKTWHNNTNLSVADFLRRQLIYDVRSPQ